MLKSKNIVIRAMQHDDLPLIAKWRSDPEVYDYFYEFMPISVEQQTRWYERQATDPSEMNFVVVNTVGKAVGTVSIYHIDWRNRKAEWGRLLIGDKDARVQAPLGLEVEALTLEYAFDHMNLHKLTCEVMASNTSVIELHKQFGFVEEGVLKSHVFKRGAYIDVHMLALFEEAYRQERTKGFLKRLLA